MSFEAQSWARRQRCGNVARKAVLMTLANWADADGFVKACRVEYIEQFTELGRSSVFNRLRELENMGAFTRERGHHSDGRTVSLNLQFQAEIGEAESPETSEDEKTKSSGLDQTKSSGLDSVSSDESSGLDQTKSSGLDSRFMEENLLKNPSTTTTSSPSSAASPADDQASEEPKGPKEASEGWQTFLQAYPFDATMAVDEAEELFEALSIKDRLKAIRFAKIYSEDLKRRGKSHARDIAAWLKGRAFDKLEAALGLKARSIGLPKPQVFVARGTDAWKAWTNSRVRPLPVTTHGGQTGWWFPDSLPASLDRPARRAIHRRTGGAGRSGEARLEKGCNINAEVEDFA